jgi:hypothetical protein
VNARAFALFWVLFAMVVGKKEFGVGENDERRNS